MSGFHAPRNDVAFRGFCLFALKVMSQYFKLSVALDCSRLLSIALDCSRFSMLSEVLFEVLELLFEVLELLFEVLQNKCSRLLSITLDYSRLLSIALDDSWYYGLHTYSSNNAKRASFLRSGTSKSTYSGTCRGCTF